MPTDNHEYNTPAKGATDWHIPLNENFNSFDTDIPIRDTESNRSTYTPKDGATYVSTDTGEVYDGDGSNWIKAPRSYAAVVDASSYENVVYEDAAAGEWVCQGTDDTSRFADPTSALQQAETNGGRVHLADSVDSTDAISATIVITDDFRGPGVRGSGNVYVDGTIGTGFRFEGSGRYENLWLRGQNGSTDLVVFRDVGRGAVIQDITCFNTNGNGMVMEGVQQATARNLTFGKCGDPSADTGELRLDNSPTDSLETNAVNIQGLHSHGANDPQGTCIQMRASNTGTDRPRNIHVSDVNLENGPSSAVPIFELCGRDNWFRGVRAMGIDDASTVFQLQAPRAPSMHIRDVVAIGTTNTLNLVSNEGATAASSQAAVDDMANVHGCDTDVDGAVINAPNFNQTDDPLMVSNLRCNGSGGVIDVTASQDATPGVFLSQIDGGAQSVSVQGARLSVSAVRNVSWSSQSADFGPRLISDDGSFSPRFGSADTTSGTAEIDFTGDFELKNGIVHASAPRLDNTIVRGTSLDDTSANGDFDTARADVVNVSDGTDAADGTTVEFEIVPRAP